MKLQREVVIPPQQLPILLLLVILCSVLTVTAVAWDRARTERTRHSEPYRRVQQLLSRDQLELPCAVAAAAGRLR
jgi:hypothetical protein